MCYLILRLAQCIPHLLFLIFFFGMIISFMKQPAWLLCVFLRESFNVEKLMIDILMLALALTLREGRVCFHFID
jgi:hypothetical protein